MKPLEATTAVFTEGVVTFLEDLASDAAFCSAFVLVSDSSTVGVEPLLSSSVVSRFRLRPLEPVSTAEARIWDPHGTPMRVE